MAGGVDLDSCQVGAEPHAVSEKLAIGQAGSDVDRWQKQCAIPPKLTGHRPGPARLAAFQALGLRLFDSTPSASLRLRQAREGRASRFGGIEDRTGGSCQSQGDFTPPSPCLSRLCSWGRKM